MSSVVISGDTSGAITLQAPAVAGSNTLSLPAVTSTVTTSGTVTGQAIGFVNKLRNGSFVVWPNGTSGSVTTSATGSASITASGWAAIATGATITWSQVTTGSNGSPQSLKLTGATSVTDITLGQRIESYDAAPLAGQTCTFQITVTNNTGASITPTIATRYAGSTDVWTSPVADLAATNLQAVANGATATLAYTLSVSSNAVNGYEIKIDFGNNFSTNAKTVTVTAADFRVTPNVATGLNSSPPTPELLPIQAMSMWCRRYFQASYDNGTAPGTATTNGLAGNGFGASNIAGVGWVTFIPEMRAAPTFAYWDSAGNASKTTAWSGGGMTSGKTDNLTPSIVPTVFGTKTVFFGFNGLATYTNASLHYTAYSDFW